MERIADNARLQAIRASGIGTVYNDFTRHGSSAPRYNVLHAASCRWLIRSNTSVPKVWFEQQAEAAAWLTRERGAEGQAWRWCTTCHAATVASTPVHVPASSRHQPDIDRPRTFSVTSVPDRRSVLAWSTFRLPFEPRDEMREFRDELHNAVATLSAGDGEALHAIYRSNVLAQFDVENVLLYNVGVGAFRASAQHELVFERSFEPIVDAPPGVPGSAHRYEYRLTPLASPRSTWISGRTLADFGPVAVAASHAKTASGFWISVRRDPLRHSHAESVSGPIGVEVVVDAPAPMRINLAALAKPLLDGIVAAFHRHAHAHPVNETAVRIARQTGASDTEIRSLLSTNSAAVLGARQLVWAWGSSVQWNPADDRIVAARIRRVRNTAPHAGTTAIWVAGAIRELAPTVDGELLLTSEAPDGRVASGR